ncbi:MAG: hypothetical protein ACOCM4_14155 [Acetivibrio ethanolgignens]
MPKIFKEETVGVSIRMPAELQKKIRLVKALYQDSISLYIVGLIEADLEKNSEAYKEKILKL